MSTKTSIQKLPLHFQKALVRDLLLSKEEVILQTIYNGKCLSLKNLWLNLPKEEFRENSNFSKNQLRENYLIPLEEKGQLIRDRAPDIPKFKKSGYKVDLKKAYKERLPYTMMGLNPLPPFERIDYVIHLFLYKDRVKKYEVGSNIKKNDPHAKKNEIGDQI